MAHVLQLSTIPPPPPRGLTSMVDTVNIEVESWPDVVQQALGYLRTATVLVPLFGLLW